jgi:hypothetical protein
MIQGSKSGKNRPQTNHFCDFFLLRLTVIGLEIFSSLDFEPCLGFLHISACDNLQRLFAGLLGRELFLVRGAAFGLECSLR